MSPAPALKLEIRNLSKRFVTETGPVQVLDDISPVSYTHLTLPTKA